MPHLNPGVLSLADAKSSKFNITFRNCEELDGWHAVFGKTVISPPGAWLESASCAWLGCAGLARLWLRSASAADACG